MVNKDKIIAYKRLVEGTGKDELHPDIVQREKDRLYKFYKIKLDKGITSLAIRSERDIVISVNNHIKKAMEGYPRAASRSTPEETFLVRLKFLTKYGKMEEIWTDGVVLPENLPQKPVKPPKKKRGRPRKKTEEVFESFVDGELEQLSESGDYLIFFHADEQEAYNKRKAAYMKEFEFNTSSDFSLLEAVIADEILLRRFTNYRLAGKTVGDEIIDDINKRLRENIKSLGVSRAQRIADDTNQKGNVAQLAESLDKKIEEIKNLTDTTKRDQIIEKLIAQFAGITLEDVVDTLEELYFMRKRTLREDMQYTSPIATANDIPSFAEMDSILKDMSKKELN